MAGFAIWGRVLALGLWLLAATGAAADTARACQLPSGLLSLAQELSGLPERAGPIPAGQAARLAARLAPLSERRILSEMEAAGLEALSGLAVDLMSEARLIADSGRQRRGITIPRLLRLLEQEVRAACAVSETSLYQSNQQERLGTFLQSGGPVDWEAVERRLAEDRVFSAGVLVVAVMAMIGLLYTGDIAGRWAMALIWNRKACRIPCRLDLAGQELEGQVVTLGRGGCRIYPLDASAYARLSETLLAGMPTLHLGETAMVVRASTLHDEVADFRFEVPLGLRLQRALLRHSTISPYYIRKARGGGLAATRRLYHKAGDGA